MAKNLPYLPADDAGLTKYANNFSSKLTAAPTDYGLVAGDAVIIAALLVTWEAAYTAGKNPSTRSTTAIAAMAAARQAMRAGIQALAPRVSANPAVTSEDKVSLGVTVPSESISRNGCGRTFGIIQIARRNPTSLSWKLLFAGRAVKAPMPDDCQKVEVQIEVSDNAVDFSELLEQESIISGRQSGTIPFETDNRGRAKRIRFRCVCNATSAGTPSYGPWSEWAATVADPEPV